MKALAHYALDVPYKVLAEDTAHIIVPLEVNPLIAGFVPPFYTLLDQIRDTSKNEDTLVLAVARAEGYIVVLHAEVDVLVTNILNAAAATFGKSSAFYAFLVGDKTPAEIRAPALGEEIDTIKPWVGPLKALSDPVLQGHGVALEQKIAAAVQRIADHDKAEQDLQQFREIGARKALVDGANALRASTYGDLCQMIDAQPNANLPPDFADRVFQYERQRRRRQAPTSKEIQQRIASNEKEHGNLLARLAETQKAEAEAAAEKAKKKAKPTQDALVAAEKKAAELQAEIAALQAKLPPPATPPPATPPPASSPPASP